MTGLPLQPGTSKNYAMKLPVALRCLADFNGKGEQERESLPRKRSRKAKMANQLPEEDSETQKRQDSLSPCEPPPVTSDSTLVEPLSSQMPNGEVSLPTTLCPPLSNPSVPLDDDDLTEVQGKHSLCP